MLVNKYVHQTELRRSNACRASGAVCGPTFVPRLYLLRRYIFNVAVRRGWSEVKRGAWGRYGKGREKNEGWSLGGTGPGLV